MSSPPTRAGTVALVGLPNAGKSSLLNQLLGSKLSIVTPFAQTTRERVIGIDTRDGVQMVFIDTPGIVRPAYLLHRSLIELVDETISDADVVVLVTDASRPVPELEPDVIDRAGDASSPRRTPGAAARATSADCAMRPKNARVPARGSASGREWSPRRASGMGDAGPRDGEWARRSSRPVAQ